VLPPKHAVTLFQSTGPNIDDDLQVGAGQPGPRHRGERFGVDGVATGEA
jgi:hypothetical protein